MKMPDIIFREPTQSSQGKIIMNDPNLSKSNSTTDNEFIEASPPKSQSTNNQIDDTGAFASNNESTA